MPNSHRLSYDLIMCLIFVALRVHPSYPLVIAANRDEYYDRRTAPAAFWPEAPDLLAGRDLRAGGTWIGVTRTGRIAALTNYRDPESNRPDAPSRGAIVTSFLLSREEPLRWLQRFLPDVHRYNGFSFLAGQNDDLYYFCSRGEEIVKLTPGIHGLSNHFLNTPWPKVQKGKSELIRILSHDTLQAEDLFRLLSDRTIPPDESLPDTGVGLEWERILSPLFISSPTYGTRSSTVIMRDRSGNVTFVERSFDRGSEPVTVSHQFALQTPEDAICS